VSSCPTLPESLVFFVDESLGQKKIPEALRKAGTRVEVHGDHFRQGERDEVWLTEVGRKGWIVLTKDARIRYRVIEQNALVKAKVAAFVLAAGNLTGDQMAELFVQSLPRIRRFISKNKPPFIAQITKGGAVSLFVSPP
jgi:predicted nuclease of predicted toxin-antitoxin system